MSPQLNASLDPFQALHDLAQRIETIDDAATRGRAVIDLSRAIVAAQAAQLALVEEKRQLEAKVRSFETWETEKQRYWLRELPPGVFVFELIQGLAKPGEPIHQLCQRCYNKGRKSILHRDEQRNGVYNLSCDDCDKTWQVGHFSAPSSTRFGPGGGGGPNSWMES